MNSLKSFKNFLANNKLIQFTAALPFLVCVILDIAFDWMDLVPWWVVWFVLVYAWIVFSIFQKQYKQLGGLTILWTVLGGTVFLILDACLQWNRLLSLPPLAFMVTQLEVFLLVPREKQGDQTNADDLQ